MITVTTFPNPESGSKHRVGAAMAGLLEQVPAGLREQIRDAWSEDLTFMFSTGMDAGQHVVWDAVEKHGLTAARKPACQQWCSEHDDESGVCRRETVYVDFNTSAIAWGSTGLTWHPDESAQVFVEFPGYGAAYLSPENARAFAQAVLQVADDAIGGGAK